MQPTDNLLLRALPDAERERLIALSSTIEFALGDVLYEQDQEIETVHFLTSGCASVLIAMEDGRALEPAVVGREGVLGFPLALGDNRSRWRCVIELPGEAYVIPRRRLAGLLRESGDLGPLLMHYASLLITFVAQSAACTQFHPVEQRAARWLLLLHERAGVDQFPITHEWLAYMLGIQRPSVSVALESLARTGAIRQRRGLVEVLDRARLQELACECYERVQAPFREIVTVMRRGSEGGVYQPGGPGAEQAGLAERRDRP